MEDDWDVKIWFPAHLWGSPHGVHVRCEKGCNFAGNDGGADLGPIFTGGERNVKWPVLEYLGGVLERGYYIGP